MLFRSGDPSTTAVYYETSTTIQSFTASGTPSGDYEGGIFLDNSITPSVSGFQPIYLNSSPWVAGTPSYGPSTVSVNGVTFYYSADNNGTYDLYVPTLYGSRLTIDSYGNFSYVIGDPSIEVGSGSGTYSGTTFTVTTTDFGSTPDIEDP